MLDVTSAPTQTYRDNYAIAARQFGPLLEQLKDLHRQVEELEKELETVGAPHTPGRWPQWTRE
jgi:hypothetical protein